LIPPPIGGRRSSQCQVVGLAQTSARIERSDSQTLHAAVAPSGHLERGHRERLDIVPASPIIVTRALS